MREDIFVHILPKDGCGSCLWDGDLGRELEALLPVHHLLVGLLGRKPWILFLVFFLLLLIWYVLTLCRFYITEINEFRKNQKITEKVAKKNKNIFFFTVFFSWGVSEQKGGHPISISNMMTPRDHQSQLLS